MPIFEVLALVLSFILLAATLHMMFRGGPFWERLGFNSAERVEFEFRNYGPLRNKGLTHREACNELDRLWKEV